MVLSPEQPPTFIHTRQTALHSFPSPKVSSGCSHNVTPNDRISSCRCSANVVSRPYVGIHRKSAGACFNYLQKLKEPLQHPQPVFRLFSCAKARLIQDHLKVHTSIFVVKTCFMIIWYFSVKGTNFLFFTKKTYEVTLNFTSASIVI